MEVVSFQPELAAAFTALNRAWIEQHFHIEAADLKILADPKASIVDLGGQIFFALDGDTPVGTVAAIKGPGHRFELAKMAVAPSHRGRGLGALLGEAVIAWAKEQGAEALFLLTNSSLTGAIRLYERLGFVQRPLPAPTDYARADVYMELPFYRRLS